MWHEMCASPAQWVHPWVGDGLEIKRLAFAIDWVGSAALSIPSLLKSPQKEILRVS